MGKKIALTSEEANYSNIRYRSYSINEIMAAGGTTAIAAKTGKNFNSVDTKLKKLSKDAFLTTEEANDALRALEENK